MQQPPAGGFPRPLMPDDTFYRAVRPEYVLDNGMVSPQAFNQASASRKLSVDWAALCRPQDTYYRWPNWGEGRAVAAITAQACWEFEQQIEYSPTPGNPAHSDVSDRPNRTLGRDKIRRALAQSATLLKLPPQP